jgi:hypothetical protein
VKRGSTAIKKKKKENLHSDRFLQYPQTEMSHKNKQKRAENLRVYIWRYNKCIVMLVVDGATGIVTKF